MPATVRLRARRADRLGRAGGAGRRGDAARGGAGRRPRARTPAGGGRARRRIRPRSPRSRPGSPTSARMPRPARAAVILNGLGFDEEAQDAAARELLRRLADARGARRVLFAEPDLLLLDEPTNHLDLEASLWLEDYLCRYPHTLLLVSHDRHLLNRVPRADRPSRAAPAHELRRRLRRLRARPRRERLTLQAKERAADEARRRHMQAFVDRFRYKASKARQAQSRLKAIEQARSRCRGDPGAGRGAALPGAKVPAAAADHARSGAARATATTSCSTASTCASTPTTGSRCSAPTATASRPSQGCSPARWRRMGGEIVLRAQAPGRLLRPAPDRGADARAERAAAPGAARCRTSARSACARASAASASARTRPICPRRCSRAARRRGSPSRS